MPPSYEEARAALRAFVDARDWDKFHDPKDLAASVAIEAGELLELFQWRAAGKPLDAEERARLAAELADVAMYLMLLADKADIDLPRAVQEKLAHNEARYPVEKARGRSVKYDRLG